MSFVTLTSNPANTQHPEDIPLKVLTFITCRRPSGNSQWTNIKIDDLMKKIFLEAIVLVLHIYSCFLQEEQTFKSSKQGHLWDPVAGCPGDQLMGCSRDTSHTCFLNSTCKHIKLTLTGYSQTL